MITMWLEGSTPHVDAGLRVESTTDVLVNQLNGEDGWMVVPLIHGGELHLQTGPVIAFQEE